MLHCKIVCMMSHCTSVSILVDVSQSGVEFHKVHRLRLSSVLREDPPGYESYYDGEDQFQVSVFYEVQNT